MIVGVLSIAYGWGAIKNGCFDGQGGLLRSHSTSQYWIYDTWEELGGTGQHNLELDWSGKNWVGWAGIEFDWSQSIGYARILHNNVGLNKAQWDRT